MITSKLMSAILNSSLDCIPLICMSRLAAPTHDFPTTKCFEENGFLIVCLWHIFMELKILKGITVTAVPVSSLTHTFLFSTLALRIHSITFAILVSSPIKNPFSFSLGFSNAIAFIAAFSLFVDDFHTCSIWFIFPHLLHFLPNAGHLPFWCLVPQYVQSTGLCHLKSIVSTSVLWLSDIAHICTFEISAAMHILMAVFRSKSDFFINCSCSWWSTTPKTMTSQINLSCSSWWNEQDCASSFKSMTQTSTGSHSFLLLLLLLSAAPIYQGSPQRLFSNICTQYIFIFRLDALPERFVFIDFSDTTNEDNILRNNAKFVSFGTGNNHFIKSLQLFVDNLRYPIDS